MGDQLKTKLEKLRDDALPEKERREGLSLFHDHAVEYDVKQELYHQLIETEHDSEERKSSVSFEQVWKKMQASKAGAPKQRKLYHVWYAAAAVLIMGLLIANLLQEREEPVVPLEYYTAIAPKGSVSQTILPDGTVIFLNAGSELKYAANRYQQEREVFLTGEAWFDVEKVEEMPFTVHTSFYDVQVKGTEFNVKAYPDDDDVVTTLEEGSIQINSTPNLKLTQDILLEPGEQLVYHKSDKTVSVKKVRTNLFSSWKDNKLIFINMKLDQLVTLLERKYGVDISVQDQEILKYHYDGTIKNETIIEVLNIIKQTLPINYLIKDQEVVITRK